MVEHKLLSFPAVVALWTLVTLLIKLMVEIHARQNLCHFGCYVAKVKLFGVKSFVPVTRAGVFIWENFHPGFRDLGRQNRDFGNRASLAPHMNTLKFL